MSGFRLMALSALLLLALVTLSACGRRGAAEPTPTPSPIATPVEEAAAPAEAPAEAPAAETPEAEEAAAETEAEAAAEQPESPLAAEQPDSPLSPLVPTPTPTFEPSGLSAETSAETGGIVGRLLIERSTGDVPVAGLLMGVAEVIYDDEGVPRASGYDHASPYRTDTTGDGGFAIENLPPGEYTLILDAVITQYQLDDPDSGETILVSIEPGEVVDVGVLRYDSLPVPGFNTPE